MKNIEEVLQRIENKITEIEERIVYLEETINNLDDEYQTISYWGGRYVARVCDLINRQGDDNENGIG
jgi:hypothetical protein